MTEHNILTGSQLHEPKGVESANTGDNYAANGSGSGSWTSSGVSLSFVNTLSNFPAAVGGIITLASKVIYVIGADISTTNKFTCLNGAVLTGFNQRGHTLTYSGTGTMFTGSDADFIIRDIKIDCPNAEAFNFTDTVGGVRLFLAENLTITSCAKTGTFDNLLTHEFNNSAAFDTDDGVTVLGSNNLINSTQGFAQFSTSATFIGYDFGTAVIDNIELDNLIMTGPAGAIGVKGLANSGNVPTGFLARISNSSFSGGMTALNTIDVDDIRWDFSSSPPISDTRPDAFSTMTGNSTETVISGAGTPALVGGTWTVERSSHFTASTAGRMTYDGERSRVFPMQATLSCVMASGADKDVTFSIHKNGSIITTSQVGNTVKASTTGNTGLVWQEELDTGDFFEIFVANEDDAVNIIVQDAKFIIN